MNLKSVLWTLCVTSISILPSIVRGQARNVPMTADGEWTNFRPTADSRIYYVSTSGGGTCNYHLASEVGPDPFRPTSLPRGKCNSPQTAISLMRSGSPDYVLLENGNTFNGELGTWSKSGYAGDPQNQIPPQFMVIGNYQAPGSSSTARPKIVVNQGAMALELRDSRRLAVLNLHFFNTATTGSAVNATMWIHVNTSDIVVEGNFFERVTLAISPFSAATNLTVQHHSVLKNVFADIMEGSNQRVSAIGLSGTDHLIKGNIFDRVGYQGLSGYSGGLYFSHAFYIGDEDGEVYRTDVKDNVILRTVNGGKFNIHDRAILENNYFQRAAFSFGNCCKPGTEIKNNVQIDSFQHEDLNWSGPGPFVNGGWGILAGGSGYSVSDNIFAHQHSATQNLGPVAMQLGYNVRVERNIVHKWCAPNNAIWKGSAMSTDGGSQIFDNIFSQPCGGPGSTAYWDDVNYPNGNTFGRNRYHYSAVSNNSMYRGMNFSSWASHSGDPSSGTNASSFSSSAIFGASADRDAATYYTELASQGIVPAGSYAFKSLAGLEQLGLEMRKQSRAYWRPALTAPCLNNYIRAGFGRSAVPGCGGSNPPPPALPELSLSVTDANAAEANLDQGVLTVTRTGGTQAFTATYTISGSASNGIDYQTLSGSIPFAANQSSATIVITPIQDSLVEGTETVTVTLTANSAYTLSSSSAGTVSIADDDIPPPVLPEVRVEVVDSAAGEPNLSAGLGKIRIHRTGSTTANLSVTITRSGSATNSSDYQSVALTQTILAGATFKDINITPLADTAIEGIEHVRITIATNANYTIRAGEGSGTVAIQDANICLADTDRNGKLNANDFLAFISLYSQSASQADINLSGRVGTEDFAAYQNAHAAGCP